MMGFGKLILVVAVAGGILYGVSYFKRQAKLAKGNSFKLKGIKLVGGVSALNVKVIATLEMTNNTDIDFTIWKQTYRAYINDKQVTVINVDKRIDWNAHSKASVDLPIELNPKEVFGEIVNTGKNTKVTVVGSVQVTSIGILINDFPIQFNFSASDILK
jgi:LEA14-like dessication related protein